MGVQGCGQAIVVKQLICGHRVRDDCPQLGGALCGQGGAALIAIGDHDQRDPQRCRGIAVEG